MEQYTDFYHYITAGDGRTKMYKRIVAEFDKLVREFGRDLAHPNIKAFCQRTDFETYY